MDEVRNKKKRSSTRRGRSSTAAWKSKRNESENGVDNNPFEELMKENDDDSNEIYMNYRINDGNGVIAGSDGNGSGSSNRTVHFNDRDSTVNSIINEDEYDIPSMIIKTNSSEDQNSEKQQSRNHSSVSVMKMGFGNLNLSSRTEGPMDLAPSELFDSNEDNNNNNCIDLELEGDEEDRNSSAMCSFGSTSADLRAAIVSSWLTDHYEPQDYISLPRSVLYDHYLEFCQSQGTEPVNSATFGKIIRSVFPTLRTRRLGTRGNSKYHYFGIGLKTELIGDDQYSAIYAQYSRPLPSKPRNSKTDRGEGSKSDRFSYGSSTFSTSSGAAASHVYSASSGSNVKERNSTRRNGSGRRTRRHRQGQGSCDAATIALNEHGVEALLLGQHGLISSQSTGNPGGNTHSSSGAFRSLSSPNYDDFAHFLEQICTPVYSNVPPHVTFESVQAFSLVYQHHIIDLLRAISSHEFAVVEGLSEMFWMNFPPEMLTCLHCDESLRIVAIADDYLYQVLIHTLIPDVLEPVPIGITQNVRQFSKFLEGILQRTLQSPIPSSIIEVKLEASRRFCQVLRRRTSLSHLTQAIRTILCNAEQTHQMLLDWGQVDFPGIREQCDWIMRLKEGFLHWIEASFRTYLQDGVSLHVWSTWIENITDQCINGEQVMGSGLEEACSTVILRWTFYSSMIMRDLTLRSAASFGSFHLLNLLFNEYLLYSVEKRLDDHRRSVGLLSFWPTGNGQNSESNDTLLNHININQSTANHQHHPTNLNPLAFDDFFRKSAVLGPTSSPLINPATTNITRNNVASQNNPSSPLGTKLMNNQQPNKENTLI